MNNVVTAHDGLRCESEVRYRILKEAEVFPTKLARFPGVGRIRRIAPGWVVSNPAGALYHGSLLGGSG